MAAGDGFRVWFDEVVDLLHARWRADLSPEELIELVADANRLVQEIRRKRGIPPAMFFCPRCRRMEQAKEPQLTVRGLIFGTRRFGIISEEEFAALQRRWRSFQRRSALGGQGSPHGPRLRVVAGDGC